MHDAASLLLDGAYLGEPSPLDISFDHLNEQDEAESREKFEKRL